MHNSFRPRAPLAGMLVVLAAAFVFAGAACTKPTNTIKDTPPTDKAVMEKEKKEEGTTVKADGTMVKPDGTMIKPDGTMVRPDGTMVKTDGTMIKPDGTMVKPDGTMEKKEEDTMMKKEEDTMMEEKTMAEDSWTGSRYVTYSAANYDTAKSQKRVLYFHATWCPTCKVANQDFTDNAAKIPAGVVVLKTDYDSQTALKQKYGVTYQHTYVQVDAAGNAITKWNGGGVNELISNIK